MLLFHIFKKNLFSKLFLLMLGKTVTEVLGCLFCGLVLFCFFLVTNPRTLFELLNIWHFNSFQYSCAPIYSSLGTGCKNIPANPEQTI